MFDILVVFGIPMISTLMVAGFFQRDLRYFRQAEKLKIGELEALMRRHRLAVMLHFAVLAILLPILIFRVGEMFIVMAIVLAGIFLAHVNTLSSMSRPIIHSLKSLNESRLHEREVADDEAFMEEVQASRKRLGE
jgi:fatty acid desaturase